MQFYFEFITNRQVEYDNENSSLEGSTTPFGGGMGVRAEGYIFYVPLAYILCQTSHSVSPAPPSRMEIHTDVQWSISRKYQSFNSTRHVTFSDSLPWASLTGDRVIGVDGEESQRDVIKGSAKAVTYNFGIF